MRGRPTTGMLSVCEAFRADTDRMSSAECKPVPSTGQRTLPFLGGCLYLVVCTLVGNVVGEYRMLLPLGRERGLSTYILLKAAFRLFDPAFAALGLFVGIATLGMVVWSRRGRSVV